MDPLLQKARQIISKLDPQTKKALADMVRQGMQGGDQAAAIRNVVQNLDPAARQRIEAQLGVRLDAAALDRIDPATLNRILTKKLRNTP